MSQTIIALRVRIARLRTRTDLVGCQHKTTRATDTPQRLIARRYACLQLSGPATIAVTTVTDAAGRQTAAAVRKRFASQWTHGGLVDFGVRE